MPIETQAPPAEQPQEENTAEGEQPQGPSEPSEPVVVPSTPAPSAPQVPEGAAPVVLPETLSSYTVYFTTYGYGHGVGMSQNGANEIAKTGKTYEQILQFFYSGTQVK